MTVFHRVASTDEIPEGEGRCFEVADQVVAVFNIDGKYTAINDLCPHMGASLASGQLDQDKAVVSCPWHGWRFSVVDGTWVDNPRIKTDAFEVRVVDNQIEVSLPSTGQPPSTESNDGSPVEPGNAND